MTRFTLLPAAAALALGVTVALSSTDAQTTVTRQIMVQPTQATAAQAPAPDGAATDAVVQASPAPEPVARAEAQALTPAAEAVGEAQPAPKTPASVPAHVLVVFAFGAEPRAFVMPDEATCWSLAQAVRAAGRKDKPNGAACISQRASA